MAKIQGRLSKVAVGADNVTYNDITGIIDATLNLELAEITTTTHDDGAFESYITGRKNGTIDLSVRWDDAATYQDTIKDAFFNGTTLYWRFRMDEATGLDQFVALGFVTSLTPSGPNDDAAGMDATIRLTGTITRSQQS
jgi:hypothetical protein